MIVLYVLGFCICTLAVAGTISLVVMLFNYIKDYFE